jgi:hypothetical protein
MSLGGFRMNYENMSDFEINKAVAEKLGLHWHCKPLSHMNKSISWFYSDNYAQCDTARFVAIDLPDYCNSWADMGPIITASKIDLRWNQTNEDLCQAGTLSGRNYTPYSRHTNPLRAAAIVYLMMGDAE